MKIKKNIAFRLFLVVFILFLAFIAPIKTAFAEDSKPTSAITSQQKQYKSFVGNTGIKKDSSLGDIAGSLISAFLGLLAIIFTVLVIYGGYKWMVARGNPAEVRPGHQPLPRTQGNVPGELNDYSCVGGPGLPIA